MKPKRRRSGAGALHARGFALIAMLTLAAMITAFLIAIGLSRGSVEVANEREARNMSALSQAKAALIAYAASEQWQFYKNPPALGGYFQPGALAAPDMDGDGNSNFVWGSNFSSMIGRLPWKTLGIDDLRDASGEQLWYALSHDFRKIRCPATPLPPLPPPPPSGCTRINSDIQGQLNVVTGTGPASNVVAVLIAPGSALQGQDRIGGPNAVANYVEGFAVGDGVHFTFDTSALPKDTFNDRLLVITQADLMAAVEPIVAANIERDIVPLIQAYYTGWNAYPFPATFPAGTPPPDPGPGRAQSSYNGVAGQANGLLPLINIAINTSPNWGFVWSPATASVVQTGGTGTFTSGPDCSASTANQIVCQIDYDSGGGGDQPVVQVQATLLNAALAFVKPVAPGDVSMTKKDGVTPAAWIAGPNLSNTTTAAGNGTVTLTGQLDSAGTNNKRVFITISRPLTYLPVISDDFAPTINPTGAWFISNRWYRQAFFAVAPGFLPGGGNACGVPPMAPPPPLCLTVNNLRPSYALKNDKRAILVLAGRSLSNSGRPSANLPDYLENANLPAALGPGLTYENRIGTPTAINDRVVVVSP